MVFSGLLVGAALWRPTRALRGALAAAAALALMGVIYMRIGPFVPAVMSAAVLATPVAYAMARWAGVVLVPVVLVVRIFPYLPGSWGASGRCLSRPRRRRRRRSRPGSRRRRSRAGR